MLLKPLAALRTDWTTELSPSRNESVEPLFHQFKIPSRSFLSVLATAFISDTSECIIHEQRRPGASAADSLPVHEQTSWSDSPIWHARAVLRWVFAGSSSSLLASWRYVSDSFLFSQKHFVPASWRRFSAATPGEHASATSCGPLRAPRARRRACPRHPCPFLR